MEYNSAIKKKEILPFVTRWMAFEGIKLSEISQRKTNTIRSHLYVESKNVKLIETENRLMVTRGWRLEEMVRCWTKGTNF